VIGGIQERREGEALGHWAGPGSFRLRGFAAAMSAQVSVLPVAICGARSRAIAAGVRVGAEHRATRNDTVDDYPRKGCTSSPSFRNWHNREMAR